MLLIAALSEEENVFKVTNDLYAVEFKYGILFLKFLSSTTYVNLICLVTSQL